jgi:DNA-binding MarR family transcriptional regulator
MKSNEEWKEQVTQLTLLLIYLSSWEERIHKELPGVHRAWKGYTWEILDTLVEQGYITQSRAAKSVYLTEEGLEKARELEKTISIG